MGGCETSKTRRQAGTVLAIVLISSATVVAESSAATADAAIRRGVTWVLAQQDQQDHGWHSQTYGSMRGGASSTALILFAAAHLPEEHRQLPQWKQGVDFLRPGMQTRDCVACPDGTLDFPTYSTAFTLIATRRLGIDLGAAQRRKLVDYLISAQLTEANDFDPAHVDYGGWDLLGGSGARGITSGTNISVSFYAVAALADEDHPGRVVALERAVAWSTRCQNWPDGDGGFFFHPDKPDLGNKAQWEDESFLRPRSYGTTTCDGLCLMQAASVGRKTPRVQKAIEWLAKMTDVKEVPGFDDAPEHLGWKTGLKFYYFLGLSRALPLIPDPEKKRRSENLLREIVALQREDGSWRNESARMREDDPLIATAFALIALSNLLEK